jgi:hypothetical protein
MKPLFWIAVPLLLLAAAMLVAGVGEAGLWIAVVAVGVALVAIDVFRPSAHGDERNDSRMRRIAEACAARFHRPYGAEE